jgi:DNA-binding transcriptional LysR family regulator
MTSHSSTVERLPGRLAAGQSFALQFVNRLKLRHLRLIVALDDHRKLNRAAAELGLTQPAASKMLGEVEKTVGAPLFERLPRGIEPTRYGEALIRRARQMMSELSQAGDEIDALRSETGGAAAVGAITTPAAALLTDAIRLARARLARLQVSVEVEPSAVLVGRLLEARLDFVLARIPDGIDAALLDYEEIGTESIALVVRRGHPLAGRRVVEPADLAEVDWVLPVRGSLIRRGVETLLRRAGLPAPQPVLSTNSLMLTQVAIAGGDAVAAVAAPVADVLRASGGLRTLALAEPIPAEPYGLIRVKGRPLSPAARTLCNIVREHRAATVAAAAE